MSGEPRRGATLESDPQQQPSAVAPRRNTSPLAIRGLKSTATVLRSLRDCENLRRAREDCLRDSTLGIPVAKLLLMSHGSRGWEDSVA